MAAIHIKSVDLNVKEDSWGPLDDYDSVSAGWSRTSSVEVAG